VLYAADRSGEGHPRTPAEFGQVLRNLIVLAKGDARLSDAYGTGELRLAGIACYEPPASAPCSSEVMVTMTWLEPGSHTPVRRAVRLDFVPDDAGNLRLRGLSEPSSISTLSHTLFGGEIELSGRPGSYVWYPWRPQ
jgi:hypothetical protein